MASIRVNSKGDNNILLTGNIELIKSSRQALIYMSDYLSCKILDAEIEIYYSGNITETLDDVNVIANYAHCELEYDESVSIEVTDYKKVEESFQKFSQEALAIRDNECNVNDFLEFKD